MLGHNRGEQIDIIRASAFQKASDVQSVASKSFHEKAGDVKAHFRFLLSVSLFLFSQAASVAILPSALFGERFFARCKVGILVSAVLPPVNRPLFPPIRWELGPRT
jgi:hypothetical protein